MQGRFGYGVLELDKAISRLEDSSQLERERARFDRSPVYVRSGSTLFEDPDMPEPNPIADRMVRLHLDQAESRPLMQFRNQIRAEMYRALEDEDEPEHHFPRAWIRDSAKQAVKTAWVEQGIWRSNWDERAPQGIGERWKHQDPLEHEGEARRVDLKWLVTRPPPRQPRNDEERRRMEREREASRPFPQFQYQVAKVYERLVAKHQRNGLATQEPFDLGTKAYHEVKELWTKWGVWNPAWGVLPGRTWKHEHPFEDMLQIELPEALDLPRPATMYPPFREQQEPLELESISPRPIEPWSPGIAGPTTQSRVNTEPAPLSLFGGDQPNRLFGPKLQKAQSGRRRREAQSPKPSYTLPTTRQKTRQTTKPRRSSRIAGKAAAQPVAPRGGAQPKRQAAASNPKTAKPQGVTKRGGW
jgi:hypothetical protein